jgi:hypothetical protein
MKTIRSKLFTLALASFSLTFAPTSHAIMNVPVSGNSDLILVMIGDNKADDGTKTILTYDLGLLLSDFNNNSSLSFNLNSNPVYVDWLANISASNRPYLFAVVGADGSGSTANLRSLWTTSVNSSIRGSISPLGSVLNGYVTDQSSGVLQAFMQGHNVLTNTSQTFNTHRVLTDPSQPLSATNPYITGASYDTRTVGVTSAAGFKSSWEASWDVRFAPVGQKAEFFKIVGGSGGSGSAAIIEDFFAATETAANPGGFWSITNNVLADTGAPAAPVPEASEWAMMLGGLGLVGFFARRREQKKNA